MRGKEHFLERLTARIDAAQQRWRAHPDDVHAEMYAKSLKLLYDDFAEMPAGHPLFRNWGRRFGNEAAGTRNVGR